MNNNQKEHKQTSKDSLIQPPLEEDTSLSLPPTVSDLNAFPLSREATKSLKNFFLLTILAENSSGISGYQIKEKYSVPRTNAIRILELFEKEGYVETEEVVLDGRAQKLYKPTVKGLEKLESLKEKWSPNLTFYADLAPLEKYANPFKRESLFQQMLQHLQQSKTKDEAIDFFRKYEVYLQSKLQSLEGQLLQLQILKNEIGNIISSITFLESFSSEKLEAILIEMKEKM